MHTAAAVFFALLIAGATLVGQPGVALADGGWLDAEPPMRWNPARAPLPAASAGFSSDVALACVEETRTAESDEDRAVVAAGYYLVGQYVAGWDLKAILGASGFGDTCEPLDYNYFVFANGIFAGTVSPVAMNSGTDGAAVDVRIVGSDRLTVQFLRSGPGDPSCCASRESTGTYSISRLLGSPVLLLESATAPA